jgi:hypothetical protein
MGNAMRPAPTGWENREYDFYLLLGQNLESEYPWIKANWSTKFESYFDKLLQQSQEYDRTAMRATAFKEEKRLAKKDGKEFIYHVPIKTGRLRWNNQTHNNWLLPGTTGYYFQHFELWAPIWTICEKRKSPPDIYISIYNENDVESKRKIQFGYFIVIAVASDVSIASTAILKELSEKINARATVLKKRKWGKPEKAGNWTFPNWIQDTFSNGIYKNTNIHSFDFDDLQFEPVFKIIHRE